MRARVSFAVISLGLGLGMWMQSGQTESDRDFVFTDEEGHLVLRFAGTGAAPLASSQVDEISNAEFSNMVHDRLRADLLFETEPRDPEWAAWMEPRIEEHVRHVGREFVGTYTECRAASCRVIMEQHEHWNVPAHQAALETVQQSLDAFIAAHRQEFEPVYLISAYYQESERPHIKAFLRRVERTAPAEADGRCENHSELCYGQRALPD